MKNGQIAGRFSHSSKQIPSAFENKKRLSSRVEERRPGKGQNLVVLTAEIKKAHRLDCHLLPSITARETVKQTSELLRVFSNSGM